MVVWFHKIMLAIRKYIVLTDILNKTSEVLNTFNTTRHIWGRPHNAHNRLKMNESWLPTDQYSMKFSEPDTKLKADWAYKCIDLKRFVTFNLGISNLTQSNFFIGPKSLSLGALNLLLRICGILSPENVLEKDTLF